ERARGGEDREAKPHRTSYTRLFMYSIVACWSRSWNASTSPIVTIPPRTPSSTTGRWRIRRSVISAAHSSILVLELHVVTGVVITSATVVPPGGRSGTTTRRSTSRSVKIPASTPSASTTTPPMLRSFIRRAASRTVAVGGTETTSVPLRERMSRTVAMVIPVKEVAGVYRGRRAAATESG